MSEDILYCDFCTKSQHEVRKLIAGPTAHICDECVCLCAAICIHETQSTGWGGWFISRERPLSHKELIKEALSEFAAQGIEARSDETPQAAQPERREPDGEADAPNPTPGEE